MPASIPPLAQKNVYAPCSHRDDAVLVHAEPSDTPYAVQTRKRGIFYRVAP